MFTKLLFLILVATMVAATLLALRQRRIETTYEMANLHSRVNQTRYELWALQVEIAHHLNPEVLQASIVRAQLDLEPLMPYANLRHHREGSLAVLNGPLSKTGISPHVQQASRSAATSRAN